MTDALSDLWAMLQTGQGWFLFERPGSGVWCPAGDRARFVKWAEAMAYPGDCAVNAVPLLKYGEDIYHTDSSVLWARVDSGRQVARLRRFRVRPTLVLREGVSVRHVALWALEEPLDPVRTDRANRRIAHWLGSPKKHCGIDFRLHPPGTVLRRSSRPVVVRPFGGSGEAYAWGGIVKGLPDAPDPTEAFLRKIGKLP